MRKILFVFVFMIGFCGIRNYANAQSRVTNEMALKIAYTAQHDYRRVVRDRTAAIFCDANRITSMMEYDKIMEDILHHKDKVEKFICSVFNQYGTGDMGYDAFKSTYGFRVAEYEIAIAIYNDWRAERDKQIRIRQEQEEREKKAEQIEKDNRLLAKWQVRGKDTVYGWRSDIIPPNMRLSFIGIERLFLYGKDTEGLIHESGSFSQSEWYQSQTTYTFIVDEQKKVTWLKDCDILRKFEIVTPGFIPLNGLDTMVAIPTTNDLVVMSWNHVIRPPKQSYNSGITSILAPDNTDNFDELEISISRKKNGEVKVNNARKLRNWFQSVYRKEIRTDITPQLILGTDDENVFINTMVNNYLLKWIEEENWSKYKFKVKIYGIGKTRYYINQQFITSTDCPFKLVLISKKRIK